MNAGDIKEAIKKSHDTSADMFALAGQSCRLCGLVVGNVALHKKYHDDQFLFFNSLTNELLRLHTFTHPIGQMFGGI